MKGRTAIAKFKTQHLYNTTKGNSKINSKSSTAEISNDHSTKLLLMLLKTHMCLDCSWETEYGGKANGTILWLRSGVGDVFVSCTSPKDLCPSRALGSLLNISPPFDISCHPASLAVKGCLLSATWISI